MIILNHRCSIAALVMYQTFLKNHHDDGNTFVFVILSINSSIQLYNLMSTFVVNSIDIQVQFVAVPLQYMMISLLVTNSDLS